MTYCFCREFKIKSGEWFLEQQAKKFPEGILSAFILNDIYITWISLFCVLDKVDQTVCYIVLENRHETTGDKLTQSYQQFRWPLNTDFYCK